MENCKPKKNGLKSFKLLLRFFPHQLFSTKKKIEFCFEIVTTRKQNSVFKNVIYAVGFTVKAGVGIGIGYQVSSIGYLRLFSVKVSGIGYPIPNFKVSGIGIRYRKADLRYRLGIGYLNRYFLINSDCFETNYLTF